MDGTFKTIIKSACRIDEHTNRQLYQEPPTCTKWDRGDVSVMMDFAVHEDVEV